MDIKFTQAEVDEMLSALELSARIIGNAQGRADRRAISRTVNALAAKKLLVIQGGMLRISEEFIRQAG